MSDHHINVPLPGRVPLKCNFVVDRTHIQIFQSEITLCIARRGELPPAFADFLVLVREALDIRRPLKRLGPNNPFVFVFPIVTHLVTLGKPTFGSTEIADLLEKCLVFGHRMAASQ